MLSVRVLLSAIAIVAGLTGLVVAIVWSVLGTPASDLITLVGFLFATGGGTVLLGLAAPRLPLPRRVTGLRTRLVLISVVTATLALANVGVTASLMFLSFHDLILLMGLLVFSVGISVFVAHAFSEPTVRSVGALLQAAERVSAGDLDARVRDMSRDEIGELGRAFNEMAGRLQEEQKRREEIERARLVLVTAVSHDLRTPLASVRAMVESMSDGVVTEPDTVERYLRTTLAEVDGLSHLVDDLISDTLESMGAQASARALNLEGIVEGQSLSVIMDTRRVQRVLYNLVQNSIRHTPRDGTIYISARDAGEDVSVEVADTGEGISSQDIPHVFDRSFRADQSRSRGSGGAGLGLSIAKGIVEAHGGHVWVESAEGEGSVFGFTLPKGLPQYATPGRT